MQDRRRFGVGEQEEVRTQFPPPSDQPSPAVRQPAKPASVHRNVIRQDLEIEGVYVISVAARILDMHPQTLRKYERLGLINPVRTVGMLRLYSQGDIRKIQLIRHLMDNLGLNLNGVVFALALVENLQEIRERIADLPEDNPAKAMVEKEIAQLLRNLNLTQE